jgi:hypothetical protein
MTMQFIAIAAVILALLLGLAVLAAAYRRK